MKFVLAKSYRYWWPVTVTIPDPENAGDFLKHELRIQFEPQPREEEIADSEAAGKLKSLREIEDFEIARFRRVIRNWDGVIDEAGELVPFSQERLDMALQFNWFRAGVKDAFDASISRQGARLGN